MDTLARIEAVTDQWVRNTDKREAVYSQVAAYQYASHKLGVYFVPRRLTEELDALDDQALALAESLCDLADEQIAANNTQDCNF
jgi:hypothetical protein